MAIANLELARMVPACSSGVRVGRNFSSCSTVVMRFLSCHFQSFHCSSGISDQKPRPAEWNCFSVRSLESDGGSSFDPSEDLFISRELYEPTTSCQVTGKKSGECYAQRFPRRFTS